MQVKRMREQMYCYPCCILVNGCAAVVSKFSIAIK